MQAYKEPVQMVCSNLKFGMDQKTMGYIAHSINFIIICPQRLPSYYSNSICCMTYTPKHSRPRSTEEMIATFPHLYRTVVLTCSLQ